MQILILNARDAGDGPLANRRRYEEALVSESVSVFPTNISWSIRSCYLSLAVLPHVSSGHHSCNTVRLGQTALMAKFEVLIMT